jgi:Flp pilus assembly protein TadG
MLRVLHRREPPHFSKSARSAAPGAARLLKDARGAALLEFAIVLPLLVVFTVGIFDFAGAFNQKQKIEQAAQEGARFAAAQPTSDIHTSGSSSVSSPTSLQAVVAAVFNSLADSGVLPNANQGTCAPPGSVSNTGTLTWTYTISGCSGDLNDSLTIVINRGWVSTSGTGPPVAVGTIVTVKYPYHWRFNSVIQLLIPGASYAPMTQLTESATVHNQI